MTNAAPQTGDAYLKVTGVDSYVEIASIADYSIATTGELSVSAWMRPDTLNFPRWEETGYVYWLGKGDSGKQEWALRMYNRIRPARRRHGKGRRTGSIRTCGRPCGHGLGSCGCNGDFGSRRLGSKE
jgi:hypothetical protein